MVGHHAVLQIHNFTKKRATPSSLDIYYLDSSCAPGQIVERLGCRIYSAQMQADTWAHATLDFSFLKINIKKSDSV